MTTSVASIDDLLIGVFLTASLLFIIIWSIMLLKWKKKYLYKIFPCVPNKTNAARIKKQEKAKSSQQQNFNLPSINIIDETLFRNHDTTRTKSSGGTTTTNIPTIRSVPEHSYQSSIDRTNPFVNDSSSSEQPSNQEEIQSSHYEMVTSKEAYLKNNIQNEFINKKLDQNNGQTCCDQVVPSINPFEVVISSFDSSNENKYANESTTDPGQLEMTPKSYHEFKF